MNRSYYSDTLETFRNTPKENILGRLVSKSEFDVLQTQMHAWEEEIRVLKPNVIGLKGHIYFEFIIPRMGKRIDTVILIDSVLFLVEFKIGQSIYEQGAIDQVFDYALDLKNFHETSHDLQIVPILIATEAKTEIFAISHTKHNDKVSLPIKINANQLFDTINSCLSVLRITGNNINHTLWENGRYYPTPTIVEAATALYYGHKVEEITRSEANAENISVTSSIITKIIEASKRSQKKSIVFVTGVPGAGKTLVGLNIATIHSDENEELYSVFLSGNGPLVKVLCEALARDKLKNCKEIGRKLKKFEIEKEVRQRIQNVHHFRDECLVDDRAPVEHVVLFDEAQRAWDIEQTVSFMKRKKGKHEFNQSEPDFLISCMDRHKDWAVIVCLVGGGQEINTGEAGISEWLKSLDKFYSHWDVYISPNLIDSEYMAQDILGKMERNHISYLHELHLSVSIRSFRAEKVSSLIKQILDQDKCNASITLKSLQTRYPIVLTRSLELAKNWLKDQARGSERYGIVVSSQAERLKPHAIDVKSPVDPIHWFLDNKDNVRSSYYLEDVATEFHIQGLELDWVCVTWDADFRYKNNGWEHWSFKGSKWQKINKHERQLFLKNAYRVLLTRARQGMIIVVPEGSKEDHTRSSVFYDPTFHYLSEIGFKVI